MNTGFREQSLYHYDVTLIVSATVVSWYNSKTKVRILGFYIFLLESGLMVVQNAFHS